ncbi:hypothetical protein CF15_05100 [Pyrodictium occultum]|uniref:CBS domain-containing protein n=1 Tax=Pyrodictium occultum TaxID=2309 RepID=A0A0V8RVR5_PYROC|nr:CBS domain-containing protein [Pyrodictium occultum]KSW12143.1 hypothetical protein CF15_05100 [Pyrodictium occultum]
MILLTVSGLEARVSDAFSPRYPYALPQTSIGELRRMVRELRLRLIPVVSDEKTMRLEGVVRRRALLTVTSTRAGVAARGLEEEPRLLLKPGEGLREAAGRMLELDEWYAPVVDDAGRLLGVLGLEGVIERLLESGEEFLEKPVSRLMETRLVYVEPGTPVYKVWQLMLSRGFSALPVVKDGRLVGVVAEHDLLARGFTRPDLESPSGLRRGPRVEEVMSTPPAAVEPDAPAAEAARLMLRRDIGRVYVVDEEGRLLGVVDRSDVVAAWLRGRPRSKVV